MSELNSSPGVKVDKKRVWSTRERLFYGISAAGLVVLGGIGLKDCSDATNLTETVNPRSMNSDFTRSVMLLTAVVSGGGFLANEAFTNKKNDDKGKYRAVTGAVTVMAIAGLVALDGGGSQVANTDTPVDTAAITSPPLTPTNGTILSTDSPETSILATVTTENLEVGIGGFPCELTDKLPPASDDGHTIAKIQGAFNSLGDPTYNVGPTDGNQGPRTREVLALWKPANEFDPGTRFSVAMCNKFQVLTDNNLDTPPTPDYHPGS